MKDSRRKVVMAKKLTLADLDGVQGGVGPAVRAGEVPRRVDELMRGLRTSLTGDPSALDALIQPRPAQQQVNPNAQNAAQRVADATRELTGDPAARAPAAARPARATPDRTTPDRTTPDRVTPDRVSPDRVTPDVPLPVPRPNFEGSTSGRGSEVAASAALHQSGQITDERFMTQEELNRRALVGYEDLASPTNPGRGSEVAASAGLHNAGLISDDRFMTQEQINRRDLAGFEDLASPTHPRRGSEVAASAGLHNAGLINDDRFNVPATPFYGYENEGAPVNGSLSAPAESPSLASYGSPYGPTQRYDDGSSLTTYDDGSTLAVGNDGSLSSSPAPSYSAPEPVQQQPQGPTAVADLQTPEAAPVEENAFV